MTEKMRGKFFDGKTSQSFDTVFNYTPFQLNIEMEGKKRIELLWQDLNRKDSIFLNREIRLNFFDYPQQVLWIDDPIVIEQLQQHLKDINAGVKFRKSFSVSKVMVIAAVFVLLLSLLFTSLPLISSIIARRIPQSVENQISNEIILNLVKISDTLVVGDKWQSANDVFLKYLETDDLEIEVHLAHVPIPNAMALPGGKIVVFSGLLKKISDAESYFALLGHETGHIVHRHILTSLIENSIIAVVVGMSIGDISGIAAVLANVAGDLTSLSYSRNMELEADEYSLAQFSKNQFSVKGVVELFEVLKEEAFDLQEELEIISTHPVTQKRIDKAKKILETQTGVNPFPRELVAAWEDIRGALDALKD